MDQEGMSAPTHTCPTCKRPLEQRDQQILDAIAAGDTYEQIGKRLGISTKTVQRVAARYEQAPSVGRRWPQK